MSALAGWLRSASTGRADAIAPLVLTVTGRLKPDWGGASIRGDGVAMVVPGGRGGARAAGLD